MRRKNGSLFILLGFLLIGTAAALVISNLARQRQAGQTAAKTVIRLQAVLSNRPVEREETSVPLPPEEELPEYQLNPGMEMPVEQVDGVDYVALLELPVLDLTLPVIGCWSMENLRIAPCRYEGSAYEDNLIVAAHNYDSHFGRLSQLAPGDRLYLTDMAGHTFSYAVAQSEVLAPTAVEEMEAGGWDLTLFTCTPGGSARFTVRLTKCK